MATPYTVDNDGALHLGPRAIPVPSSISPAARAFLAAVPRIPIPETPALSDKEGWYRHVREVDGNPLMAVSDEMIASIEATVDTHTIAGVPVYVATPKRRSAQTDQQIYLDIHGGGFIAGGGKLAKLRAARAAAEFDCICYGVDYRMPPDHPYPASLDDCIGVYNAILALHPSTSPIVGGVSAGGNLAAALALKVRDAGQPLPLALLLLSPALDLTKSGDSFETNKYIDVVLRGGEAGYQEIYADGHDLSDPYISPLFGNFERGFPPTFLQSGTRDLFLSNVTRMQRALRKANIPVDLQLWEAMPHGGFGPAPETEEVSAAIRHFISAQWK